MELEKFFLTVNLNNSEKIALDGKIGTYKNKPFFIVYAGIPLTLNIDEQKNRLCFDAKTFYYFIERVVSSKLTMREAKGFQITKTVIIAILILVGAFFLFFTPTGKELLHNLMGGNFKI